ncbi:MAG: glycoside hydrolase family 2 TIM barrel-domain containing protein [Bacillota bacterium]|nr:glycoside hydrolase family 2 TIM barrel-domain containing protein [Bacillota bacterium]
MHQSTTLNGSWTLYFGDDDGSILTSAQDARRKNYRLIEAMVPGNVEQDLVRAGLEEDPFLADHVLEFEKYEYCNWLFERTFDADSRYEGRRVTLRFGGINTFATIILNGTVIGEAANMLIPHSFDITSSLRWHESNTLTVYIRSSMNQARQLTYTAAVHGGEHGDEMTRLRMPPHCFGWDIMPRLLSAGLWRSVTLEYTDGEKLDDLYLTTIKGDEKKARLHLSYTFSSDRTRLPLYRIRIEGRCQDRLFAAEQTTHFISNTLNIAVDEPLLWWPRGYGDQPLYDVTVTLWHDDVLCDRRTFKFGIRTATVDACFDLDKPQRFQVLVNGKPVFIRGSNWVPLSALHSLDESKVERAINFACDCGCNALRCWGGNVYECERFYELCDEQGLLVWQDFSMACSGQPSDDEYARSIEQEATIVVKERRNHACLLLWAGDNEVDAVVYKNFPKGFARYNRVTREVLPRVVAAHDPYRYYLPSSPYMPAEYDHALQGPEQHLWGPRDDFKGDFYRHNTALFASEIGYHGCPSVSSLKQFISEDELWPFSGSRQWLVHNSERPLYKRGYDRNELMARQVAILFGQTPADLGDFVFASQISQAEAKKFFIEQFRIQKGRKTGLIWWNVIDGWPQISDAVVDYYAKPKLAWHIIRRCQQDVQFMLDEYRDWKHRLIAVNDTLQAVEGVYQVTDFTTGEHVLEDRFRLEPDARAELADFVVNPSRQALYLIKWQIGDKVCHSHYVAGRYPFNLEQFRIWMTAVAALEPVFDLSETCG